MARMARPRRSVLYMPGSNAQALEKGTTLAADGLILDLEDSVFPDAKEEARDRVCSAAAGGGYGGREVLIRVNGLGTAWGRDDIAAASTSGAEGIVLSKVEAAGTVREAEAIMEGAGAPGLHGALVHDGNAAGRPARRGDRRGEPAPGRLCPRHGGPGQGPARGPDRRPLGGDHGGSAFACWRRAPPASPSSTAFTWTSTTQMASRKPAGGAARWASTARP